MKEQHDTSNDFTFWQSQLTTSQTLTGFHRQGTDNAQRIHLLHGTGFSALTLKQMACNLPKDWHLWLTNVPGHGQSCQPKHIMPDWQEMASSIAKNITVQANTETNGPVIGIGHSMGGVLTLLAASKHPEVFSRIILLDPPIFIRSLLIAQKVFRHTGLWKQVPWVKAVRNRTQSWPNKTSMRKELKTKKLYKDWDENVLDDFINSATHTTSTGEIKLACDPKWEANIFGSYPRRLWQSIAKTSVHVDIVVADNTYDFIKPAVKRATHLSRFIQYHYFGNNHCFPMEATQRNSTLYRAASK